MKVMKYIQVGNMYHYAYYHSFWVLRQREMIHRPLRHTVTALSILLQLAAQRRFASLLSNKCKFVVIYNGIIKYHFHLHFEPSNILTS